MKTNIRLFVPNTTETLDFEYGLLIQYMTYNEAKSRSEISLDYYELATIDPMTNALDIVERKKITDTARMQSDRSGFTLDSHYTLSFDQRYNNKIPEQNVRQVWLWLHCNADKDFPFLVEKFTPTEELVPSRNNQLLTRLWAHEDWLARDMNPLDQQKVSGRVGLITLLRQQLATQFEQIEQDNRNKALAAIQAANPKPTPANPTSSTAAVSAVPIVAASPFSATAAQPASTVPPIIPVPPTTPQSIVPSNSTSKIGYPQLIPPPQTPPAKSKTWIWVVAACLIGIPVLVLIGRSGQEVSKLEKVEKEPVNLNKENIIYLNGRSIEKMVADHISEITAEENLKLLDEQINKCNKYSDEGSYTLNVDNNFYLCDDTKSFTLIRDYGNSIKIRDLNKDGNEDIIAVSASCNHPYHSADKELEIYQGCHPTWTTYSAFILLAEKSRKSYKKIKLNDISSHGSSIKIDVDDSDIITLTGYSYGANDPSCCSSEEKIKRYTFKGDTLQALEASNPVKIDSQTKPQIIVGLQWHSKTIDYRDPRGSHDDVAYQIVGNQDGMVLVDKTITARPDSKVTLMYDESLNLIGGKTGRYVPALANYDFPLTEGKTWNVKSEVIGNQFKDLQQAVGQVLGKETISTPMGDVEAIKVVVEHTAYLAGNEVSKGQDISWYVPELGRAVRTDETYWDTDTQSWVVGRRHEMTRFVLP